MKTFVQITIIILLGIAITLFHPFQLAMPWQSGSPASLDIATVQIMAGEEYELVESDWGRITPFNYVAVTSQYRANGLAATACTNLRGALDDWGRVTKSTRNENGCEIEARGPGPMTATIDVVADPEAQRRLRIEVRVQHTA